MNSKWVSVFEFSIKLYCRFNETLNHVIKIILDFFPIHWVMNFKEDYLIR